MNLLMYAIVTMMIVAGFMSKYLIVFLLCCTALILLIAEQRGSLYKGKDKGKDPEDR